ncbi:MAG: AgmX/PglI C-terminal domain-containing protein [Myxococcales bacterium]|nr:AgmX/PglI C-terminal domain-containing protein [Myxococcales bacterium]
MIQVDGDVGGLDQDAVDAVVASASGAVDRCWEQGVARNELVAGTLQLVLGIGRDGRTVHGYVKQSSLGEGEMERCMLDALSKRTFPKPVGGKVGVVRTSLSFELERDVRAPTPWASPKVSEVLSNAANELSACKHGATGAFSATVYVKQVELPPPDAGDGDSGADAADAGPSFVGAAISVGVAAPDEQAWGAVPCLAGVLSRAVYPTPGSWPAKLTFEL